MQNKKTECPLCGGSGLIYKPSVGLTTAKVCSCNKLKKLRKSGLSEKLQKFRFDSFNLNYYPDIQLEGKEVTYKDLASYALAGAKQFVKEFKAGTAQKGLLIYGKPGSGKTLLAAAIANEIIASTNNASVQFVVVPDWLDQIRYSYRDKSGEVTEQDLMSNAMYVDLLVLDDLGAHRYNDFTSEKIFTVLNNRINMGKLTVITTNLLGSHLEESVGERTFSRFFELCIPFPLHVDRDIRLKRNKIDTNEPFIVNRIRKTKLKPKEKGQPQRYGPGVYADYDIHSSNQAEVQIKKKNHSSTPKEHVSAGNKTAKTTSIKDLSEKFKENFASNINIRWEEKKGDSHE